MSSNDRSFRIRSATPADVPDLHALIRGLAEYERLSDICVSTEDDLASALFGEIPAAEALIARPDGNTEVCAGFALFFHTYSHVPRPAEFWLEDLFVKPEFRGAGLGRQLLKALAALAKDRRCGRFEWAVLDWNAPAIRFYSRWARRSFPTGALPG